jgi:hypothetical protein
MSSPQKSLTEAIKNLPDHFRDTFSDDFLKVLAALDMHGFAIQRADEAVPVVPKEHGLWSELSHPSIWIYRPAAPMNELQQAEPGSPEHARLTNAVIRANLLEQQRLLELLEAFYSQHEPVSFSARLIVETVELGESYLRSQGASVRIILNDTAMQSQWHDESMAEFSAFADFLA